MAARYVLSRSGSQFRFVLKAGNHETILTSELYNAKSSAEDGIESVKKNSALDERYERKDSSNGKPMFNLKASNGQVIGTSELYSSESARDGGIASVKANGPTAEVDDQT
ncbi:YegP family protein [Lysobacter antibioticus]|uniref:YegP family protein n=1 Tax=Lysobacter antibioticus TaxID=84531 RepID=UPI00071751B6|nr:YegP family protein [Lysobacter antibioticus]